MDARQLLEEYGESIDIELEDGDIVTDVVVLARVQRLDHKHDSLITASSDATGGITLYGMICAAKLEFEDAMMNPDEDD